VTAEQTKFNLLDCDRQGLERFFSDLGEKSFRATQVMKWIYHQGVTDFSEMTNISKALRARLGETAVIEPPQIVREQLAADGTRKWLMAMGGKNAIETVFIPEPNRGTLCVSSQVGCALNCSFCSTATQGFSRNLSTSEIIGQVWMAAQAVGHGPDNRRITNVVMMGMGEPLMNFEAVAAAMSLMRDDFGFGLSSRRVTLSTAGLIPGIDRLNETIDVSLAVSLHSPVDSVRNELVPLNKKYPIKDLLEACRRFIAGKNRHVTFEYTLIKGVNDSDELARQLGKLLRTVPSKLNLIPFNPFPGTDYQRSDETTIRRFQKIVLDAGIVATVRRTRGDDIDAACGQLVGKVMDRTRRQARFNQRLAAKGGEQVQWKSES
jgi:23S rRNA (adenine2503-C2)-methyltransferase